MRTSFSRALLLSLTISAISSAAPLKPRIVVVTDISTWETDDHESMTRLLAHADLFEIEGLIISTGYSIESLNRSPEKAFINIIHDVINAYEKDLPNLMKRSNQVGHSFDDARGDTPAFLYLMPTGLNNAEDPSQCSWSGTYKVDADNLWMMGHLTWPAIAGSFFSRRLDQKE